MQRVVSRSKREGKTKRITNLGMDAALGFQASHERVLVHVHVFQLLAPWLDKSIGKVPGIIFRSCACRLHVRCTHEKVALRMAKIQSEDSSAGSEQNNPASLYTLCSFAQLSTPSYTQRQCVSSSQSFRTRQMSFFLKLGRRTADSLLDSSQPASGVG